MPSTQEAEVVQESIHIINFYASGIQEAEVVFVLRNMIVLCLSTFLIGS